mmetsp:Transcript_42583/g.77339  ORF Transcript_42583/g.77339 Transcript_42583/m.77339 type:complete len:274 (-) Transcript_42583:67-888(-)
MKKKLGKKRTQAEPAAEEEVDAEEEPAARPAKRSKAAKQVEAAAEEAPARPKKGTKAAEKVEAEEEPARPRKNKAHRLAAAAEAFEEEDEEPDEEAEPESKRGVIFIGHVPKGFAEDQMKTFFTQFGVVTRIRMAHSKKTSNFKGYGWVEFLNEDVAKIVAETMHKYLLSGKTIECRFVPPDKLHPKTFKGANRKGWFKDCRAARIKQHTKLVNDRPTVEVNDVQVPQMTARQEKRRLKSEKRWKDALQKLGVEYEFDDDATLAAGDPDDIIV